MHFQAEGFSQVPSLTLQLPTTTLLPVPCPARDGLYALSPKTLYTQTFQKGESDSYFVKKSTIAVQSSLFLIIMKLTFSK